MDRYLYLRSDESDIYFEDNTTTRFRVQLKFPLFLPGLWKVGLVEFHATEKGKSTRKADEGLYIYTDLCRESIVNGEERPLLRRLEKTSKGKWDYNIDSPFYLPVAKSELRQVEVYIKGERDEDSAHLVKPLHLTLHLKSYPFW